MQPTIERTHTLTPHARSTQEIESEISRLFSLLDRIPHETAFGDSNTDALLVQTEVLRERLTLDEVYEDYDDAVTGDYVLSAAFSAVEWLYDGEEAPSVGWLSMIGEDDRRPLVN